MWHGVKKIKFSSGKDANDMLMRKLLNNFLRTGTLTTTLKKARVLKSQIEKIVEKSKSENEANRNSLMKKLNDPETISFLFKEVGPVIKDKIGGYVRIVKLGARDSDSAQIAQCEWVYPIVLPNKPGKDAKKNTPADMKNSIKNIKK